MAAAGASIDGAGARMPYGMRRSPKLCAAWLIFPALSVRLIRRKYVRHEFSLIRDRAVCSHHDASSRFRQDPRTMADPVGSESQGYGTPLDRGAAGWRMTRSPVGGGWMIPPRGQAGAPRRPARKVPGGRPGLRATPRPSAIGLASEPGERARRRHNARHRRAPARCAAAGCISRPAPSGRGTLGLDLATVGGDSQVRDGRVLRLARPMAHHAAETAANAPETTASSVSLRVPIWLTLTSRALAHCSATPRRTRSGFVTKRSSPTSWIRRPRSAVSWRRPAQSLFAQRVFDRDERIVGDEVGVVARPSPGRRLGSPFETDRRRPCRLGRGHVERQRESRGLW